MHKRIYIAGKISDPNPAQMLKNIGAGQAVTARLIKRGFTPFSPFLDPVMFFQPDAKDITVAMIQNYSMRWLEVCDMVLVLPDSENSLGTMAECQRAHELGIPIIYDEKDLDLYQQ